MVLTARNERSRVHDQRNGLEFGFDRRGLLLQAQRPRYLHLLEEAIPVRLLFLSYHLLQILLGCGKFITGCSRGGGGTARVALDPDTEAGAELAEGQTEKRRRVEVLLLVNERA